MDETAASYIAEGDPWQVHAACGGDPDLMDETTAPKVFAAVALCARCPVIERCKSWADKEPDYVGVAGGLVYTRRRRSKSVSRYTRDGSLRAAEAS